MWSNFPTAAVWAISSVRSIRWAHIFPRAVIRLPSTLLMTVIPAQVAGVKTICVACPRPSAGDSWRLRSFSDVANVFRMGGAQAIAAMAFGTETVPNVDRIVGPGNIYVAAAKKLIAGEIGIDFVAGPTEIVIIADEADPRWIAADMLAQAEHDVDASAILLTTSRALAEAVAREIERQLETLPTAPVACESIETNSAIVVVPNRWIRRWSFRTHSRRSILHFTIRRCCRRFSNAGSVFWAACSPEAAGDYASGPNHVLPTSGAARHARGLVARRISSR